MSKHTKAIARLCMVPPCADFKWDELRSLLEHLGYVLLKGKGSRWKFFHSGKNALIICHQPHPALDVDKGCLADIAAHLKAHGLI